MGKIPSSDPDWLLEFPLFYSFARFSVNARMTVWPPLPPTTASYGFPRALQITGWMHESE